MTPRKSTTAKLMFTSSSDKTAPISIESIKQESSEKLMMCSCKIMLVNTFERVQWTVDSDDRESGMVNKLALPLFDEVWFRFTDWALDIT